MIRVNISPTTQENAAGSAAITANLDSTDPESLILNP